MVSEYKHKICITSNVMSKKCQYAKQDQTEVLMMFSLISNYPGHCSTLLILLEYYEKCYSYCILINYCSF